MVSQPISEIFILISVTSNSINKVNSYVGECRGRSREQPSVEGPSEVQVPGKFVVQRRPKEKQENKAWEGRQRPDQRT